MNYPVHCTVCGGLARFKVASTWSDGTESELKTYALTCEPCLPAAYAEAKRRQAVCPLEFGETLGVPRIYERGLTLQPRPDLELS